MLIISSGAYWIFLYLPELNVCSDPLPNFNWNLSFCYWIMITFLCLWCIYIQIYNVDILFCHSLRYLFISWMVYFEAQMSLIVEKSEIFTFHFLVHIDKSNVMKTWTWNFHCGKFILLVTWYFYLIHGFSYCLYCSISFGSFCLSRIHPYWEGNRQEGQGSPNEGTRLQVPEIFISLKWQEGTNYRDFFFFPSLYKFKRRFLLKCCVAMTPGFTWS